MAKVKFNVDLPEIAKYDYRKNPDGRLAFSCVQDLRLCPKLRGN